MKQFLIVLAVVGLLAGCMEYKSENPVECYRLWSGEEPPPDIKLIHAKYWQSPHWTKEYILYMELIAPPQWSEEFIKQNQLVRDSGAWTKPSDAPNWFVPTPDYLKWKMNSSYESSRYFEDTLTGKMFLYEIQL